MIHTSLSPNTEGNDLWQVLKALLLPWNWLSWKSGKDIRRLESAFQKKLGSKHAITFQRGRDALFVLLQALGIGEGDEVILQAYTCIVVPNAIRYSGAKPVYVDIEEEGFNIDPSLVEKAITSKTKAVIVQHTFGEPADLDVIQEICHKHNVLLVEDCAHSLSATYQGKPVGTFGKAAIFSFGRDKIISSMWGGMATTDDDELAAKLRDLHDELPAPGLLQTKRALLHPLFFALIKPLYHWKIGKGLLVLSQRLRLIPRVIFPAEKRGRQPSFIPQQMSNILARLALHQLKKLDRFHQHRRQLAQQYQLALQEVQGLCLPASDQKSDPAWLRYTIRMPDAAQVIRRARKQGIYLGDWYRSVLAPGGCDLKNFRYQKGSCPRAELAAEETLNLPTHIQMTDSKADQVIAFLKD